MRPAAAIGLALTATALGAWWFLMRPADEASAVRARLLAFANLVNASPVHGQAPEIRGQQIGGFFADDVDVDLGHGAAPIRGRDTVVGMAERLQPRTAAFRLELEDVSVAMATGAEAADVHLTAAIIQRSIGTGDRSLDAREFTIGMRRVGGTWQIARVQAVDTLEK
jgi:hypothetical protein